MKEILIFTNSYPYGPGETFFKDELEFLSKRFDKIYLQPIAMSGEKKVVPNNVTVLEPIFVKMGYIQMIIKGIFHLGELGSAWRVFNKHFVHSVGQYLISRRIFNHPPVQELLSKVKLKYFYWGKGAASMCIFFPVPGKKAVRFHGFDLYESDERPGNVVSLRKNLLKSIDKLIFISDHGQNYLAKKYNVVGEVHRLGIPYTGNNPNSFQQSFTIVSCSALVPVKRVNYLANVLSHIKEQVNWIHIGSGPDKEKVEKILKTHPVNIKTTLLGYLKHDDVIKFYNQNHADVLINVSQSEGVPFSMMEAISFGIPLMGTKVGGVGEIITEKTGILVDVKLPAEEFAKILEKAIRDNYFGKIRESSREFYFERFNADVNYNKLADTLESLL